MFCLTVNARRLMVVVPFFMGDTEVAASHEDEVEEWPTLTGVSA
jgi:hypothetical protein